MKTSVHLHAVILDKVGSQGSLVPPMHKKPLTQIGLLLNLLAAAMTDRQPVALNG